MNLCSFYFYLTENREINFTLTQKYFFKKYFAINIFLERGCIVKTNTGKKKRSACVSEKEKDKQITQNNERFEKYIMYFPLIKYVYWQFHHKNLIIKVTISSS